MSILRALFLLGAFATVSSCHAAPPENQAPQIPVPHETAGKVRPTPRPTAEPTFTPFSSTPTPAPSPTTPAVGTSPGPLIVGPIEVHLQPVQLQPVKDLHVTASGIPEKITLASEVKAIPFDVSWPKDPLNISIDLKNGSAASKESEFQKVIDTFSQLNREYKEQLSDLNKKLADAEQKEKKLWQEIDNLKRVLDERKKAEQKILDEAQQERKKLEEQHARGMPEPEYQKRLKNIDEDTAKKMKHVAEDATRTMINDALLEIFYLVMFGAFGGVASVMIDRARREQQAKVKVGTEAPEASTTRSDSDNGSKKDTGIETFAPELATGILLGTVAALIVPIGMLFIPGVNLQTARADPFTFVSLCSLCFAVGMIGEPFIEFVLDKLRSLTTKKERTEPASSGQIPVSIAPTASETTRPPADPASNQNSLREGLSAMSGGASLIMGWALAIFGATAVGLIGGKYLHPTGAFRFIYLLFLPGWLFLAISIFYGEKVTRRLTAGVFAKNNELLVDIGEAMNAEYDKQRWYFQLSLLTLGAWLVCLLILWVITGDISGGK